MKLSLKDRIALLTKLGNYIGSENSEWKNIKEETSLRNNWFIPEFIDRATEEIRSRFLQEELLNRWVSKYPGIGAPEKPRQVGIVMAGNLPAVGFHDMLCGLLSGHELLLKMSSKDNVLIKHFIDKLTEWAPEVKEQVATADMLKGCDAYIATGSNNSARYFNYYFGRYPNIIRKNRTSVAILDGSEKPEDLKKLADDVLLYFGLGCRNVTKIYVPEDYDFVPLLESMKSYEYLKDLHHFRNNFDYQFSLLLLNNTYYMSNDIVLLREHDSVFSPVGVLNYSFYKDKENLITDLKDNTDLQCIESIENTPFGASQKPNLDDYADGIDTMEFLTHLNNE